MLQVVEEYIEYSTSSRKVHLVQKKDLLENLNKICHTVHF